MHRPALWLATATALFARVHADIDHRVAGDHRMSLSVSGSPAIEKRCADPRWGAASKFYQTTLGVPRCPGEPEGAMTVDERTSQTGSTLVAPNLGDCESRETPLHEAGVITVTARI